jgi:hypothetical protein
MSTLSRFGSLLVLTPAILIGEEPSKETDRVGFPEGYARFAVLRTVLRDNGAKRVTIYGNDLAAGVTNKAQLPYPNGAVLVMETAGTAKDGDGKPVMDADGLPKKDQVLGLHVMRRGPDFGAAYGEKRSGQWEYAEYRADRSYITTPANSATCSECHIKAGPEKDYVYNGRFADTK